MKQSPIERPTYVQSSNTGKIDLRPDRSFQPCGLAILALAGYEAIRTVSGMHVLILGCASVGALSFYLLFRRPLAPILYIPVAWGLAWLIMAYAGRAVWGDCL